MKILVTGAAGFISSYFPSNKENFINKEVFYVKMKKIFQTLIKDFHLRGIENYKKRDIKIPINTKKIISLIGPRRSGKTYLFYQIIHELKTSIDNIIYINFEDERLDAKKEDLNMIIAAYLEIYPDKNLKNVYFFFDEIQNVDGWEQFVRRIYDSISKNIFLTGSSAKLLSKEIATSLRGRTISYEVYPLSFGEFLDFCKINHDDLFSTTSKAKLKSKFNSYLNKGGFAETLFFEDELRIKVLQNYSEVMLYRDIVERYDLSDTNKLKYFLKKSISSISTELSINKIYNEFKSQNIPISKDLLYEYPKYFEDSFYLFFLQKYSDSISKQEFGLRKVYCIDTGLANSISFRFSEDIGRLLENLVFIELKRRGKEIYYHKGKKECDFVIKQGLQIVEAIQVTQSLSDANTKKREIEGLIEAMTIHNLKEGLILTDDEDYELEEKGRKITVKPVWKWLLE